MISFLQPESIVWNGKEIPLSFPYIAVYLQGRPNHKCDEFSRKHPSMERGKRAKIFAPFDALDGYGDAVRSKNILYTDRIYLDEEQKVELNRQLINRLCAQHQHILLIDLHSYSDEIIPMSFLRKEEPLPDLCIGVDQHFTPSIFVKAVINKFQDAGLTISVNYPYSGCFVPEVVMNGNSDCDFSGIMLEFNRYAYLYEQGDFDGRKVKRIQKAICSILSRGFSH